MANTLRLKRRAIGGGAGAPSTLANAELAYNEDTDIGYYGKGTGGSGGSATSAEPAFGRGAYVALSGDQTVAGIKTHSSFPVTPSSAPTTNYQVANKKYVDDTAAAGGGGDMSKATYDPTNIASSAFDRANHTGSQAESTITGLVADLAAKAPLAGPTFTGSVVVPDQTAADNSTKAANTKYVDAADALKAPLASPALTGNPTAPTQTAGNNSTRISTTAYVDTADALKANLASPTLTGTPAAPTAAPGTNTTQLATTAFAAALGALKANIASPTFTGDVTLAQDPTSSLHAATKQYVDSLAVNVGKRATVRAATTGNITISTALNAADVLDGVTLANGDLVLVKDQTTASQNGIYVVSASPVRATEFDTFNEHPGSLVAAQEGTANADTLWLCTANAGGTLNTTSITYSKMVIAGELLAANNLSDIANAGTARTNLGLGTMATQAASAVAITGGTVDGVTIDCGTY